ncbi:MAG: hypothetical protein A3A24_02080 [Candidatus Buchananbacteria bacterium RIFCSPLOWO2_01_FULL_46_12]|uniref:ECF transporter S component n=1 Tax=Candidatus Buchananbacteria bacterium RIFCSPLOWO2_01_FULL_46_12 TaxID=1797546 RepID=A0A1G1YUL0_9BACT|nr:MAG: hypothetical protein A3A24_02080 [Candidatus Buchananbacteria bacterium RIFCSPLOWO2_01_FULL_46_12]
MTAKNKIVIAFILIVLGVTCRLLPHWWNFTPLAAIALFSGVYLGWRYALVLPLLTMLSSDIFIGFYEWPVMLAVYGSFILIGLISWGVKKYKSVETIFAASIIASVIFFLVTNYAVWQFSPWYEKSLAGLLESYTLALPFFRNTLLGDLFYSAVLFGAYEAVVFWVLNRKSVNFLAKVS